MNFENEKYDPKCIIGEHTLYPMREAGVQVIIMEVSVTSALKGGALPIGGATKHKKLRCAQINFGCYSI